MGNRLTKTDNVTGNETYTYNAANMLLSRNAGSYTNDANGNTLTGGGRTNTWDGQNRLTQCVYNGTTTTHTDGSDGLRRWTVQGMNTTDYVLEGQSVVRSLLNGNVARTYLHGPRGPEYERLGANAPVWYLYDGLGSVLGAVDSSGTIVSRGAVKIIMNAWKAMKAENGMKPVVSGRAGMGAEVLGGVMDYAGFMTAFRSLLDI